MGGAPIVPGEGGAGMFGGGDDAMNVPVTPVDDLKLPLSKAAHSHYSYYILFAQLKGGLTER